MKSKPLTWKDNTLTLDGDTVGVVSHLGVDEGWYWKTYMHGTSPSREEAQEQTLGMAWSLTSWLRRQWAWSLNTFGPGQRTKGLADHIRKEVREVLKKPEDLDEWIDIVILGLDGFWRHGGTPEELIKRLDAKQARNFSRAWPDWRTIGDNKAIEHDRSKE